jgi:hypothetical protein
MTPIHQGTRAENTANGGFETIEAVDGAMPL